MRLLTLLPRERTIELLSNLPPTVDIIAAPNIQDFCRLLMQGVDVVVVEDEEGLTAHLERTFLVENAPQKKAVAFVVSGNFLLSKLLFVIADIVIVSAANLTEEVRCFLESSKQEPPDSPQQSVGCW